MAAIRWGIISTGNIAHDFVNSLTTLPEKDHSVVAVAARNLDKAQKFAELHSIPNYYEGYEKLAQDPNVEIVYVAALNPQHYEISMMMLEHGKHVLCEKPLCMNERQAKKLIDFAEMKKLFLMEAVWSRFIPTYQHLKKRIDEGALGEIKEVNVRMIIPLHTNQRLLTNSLGGGTILDFGIYTIQASLWAFREYPQEIKATGVVNDDGVDIKMKGELIFSGNRKAYIETDFMDQGVNEFVIIGTKGRMKIHQPFWSPTHLTDVDGKVLAWPYPNGKHEFIYPNSCGLRYEATEVRKCLRAGLLECETVSHKMSLEFHRIEDEIRRQLGVKYAADNEEY